MYANKVDIFITFYFSIGLYMKSIYTVRFRSFVLGVLALILKVKVPCTRELCMRRAGMCVNVVITDITW